MMKFTNKDAICTYLNWNITQLQNSRYQSKFTSKPIHVYEDGYICAVGLGKHPGSDFAWVKASDDLADYCYSRGRIIYIFKSCFNLMDLKDSNYE